MGIWALGAGSVPVPGVYKYVMAITDGISFFLLYDLICY